MPLDDPIGSTALDVLQRNAQDTDRFVNQTSGTVTTRLGEVITPLPVVNATIEGIVGDIDNAKDQALIDIASDVTAVSSSASAALTSISTDSTNVQTAADEAIAVEIPAQIARLGLEYPPIAYTAGLTLDSYTKTYSYLDALYIWGGTLGTVTTGNFDEGDWQPIQGDIQLRDDVQQGTSLIRDVKHVASVVALRALEGKYEGQQISLTSYYVGDTTGGGIFVWDSASTANDDGGVTIAVTGVATGRWVRVEKGFLSSLMFGGSITALVDSGKATEGFDMSTFGSRFKGVWWRFGKIYESQGSVEKDEFRPFLHDYRPTIEDGSPFNSDGANTFMGFGAGNFTMSPDNSAIGDYNIHTAHNTGVGVQSLGQLTTGYNNVGFGNNTGRKVTQGFSNTFVGRDAGHELTTGHSNVFVGRSASYGVVTGIYNVSVGDGAGYNNSSGLGNLCVGRRAGFNQTSGNYNSYLGYGSGIGAISGSYNTHLGYQLSGNGLANNSNTTVIGSRFSDLPAIDNLVALGDGSGNVHYRVCKVGNNGSFLDIPSADSSPVDLSVTDGQLGKGSTLILRSLSNVGNAITQIVAQSRIGQMFSRIVFWGGVNQNVSIVQGNKEVVRWNSAGDIQQTLNSTAAAMGTNSTMTFELSSNTELVVKVRGNDGATRQATITLS